VPLEPPVAQALAQEEPGTVRLTMADGRQRVLREPRVSGDHVMGLVDQPSSIALGQVKWNTERTSIPLEAVQSVEGRRTNTPATAGLIVGIVVGVALIARAACGGPCWGPFGD
jgi:hypothetical protein